MKKNNDKIGKAGPARKNTKLKKSKKEVASKKIASFSTLEEGVVDDADGSWGSLG